MDGAVKMPGAQVKVNTAGRVQAAQASSDTGVEFIKLLQSKGGQTKAEAQDTAKPSSKDVKAPLKDAAGKKTENLTDEVNPQDEADAEEMAQQAAVQQAAALLSGMFTESQEVTAETIVPETENLIQTGEILTEALPTPEAAVTDPTAADLTPVQPLPETPAEVTPEAVLPNPVQETPEQPEKALQTELPQQKTAEAAEKAPKPAETRPEEPKAQDSVQNVSGAQKPEETSEAGKQSAQEDLTGKENQKSAPTAQDGETTQPQAAGAETFRVFGHQEQNTFFGQKTETVSMKTAPETLPEDLGKTLGAKFADGAKTLTVELEPASLGKLTIRLTYEGDRAAVSIMATNPKTLELLNQKASEIAAILEEKTGQQTIIYTQKPETDQENYDRNPDGRNSQEDREEKQNHQQKEEHQQFDSFAQQLRLGLI